MNNTFKIYENNKKTKILFLHGFNSSHNNIRPLLKLKREYDIVAFDFPGCGTEPVTKQISIENYAEFAKKKLEELNEPVIIVGHSLGGAVATYLSTHPLVSKIVLLAPLNPFVDNNVVSWLLPTNNQEALSSMKFLVGNKEKHIYFENIEKTSQAFLKLTLMKTEQFKHIVYNEITNHSFLKTKLMEKFITNTKDTILIQGDIDKFISLASINAVEKTFGWKKHLLSDTGHSLIFERPNKINDLLNAFVV